MAWSLSYELFYYLVIPLAIGALGLRERSVAWRAVFFASAGVSLLVWCAIWEIVGRLDLMLMLPPFTEVLRAAVELVQTPSWQSATVTTLRAFAIGPAHKRFVPPDPLIGRIVNRLKSHGEIKIKFDAALASLA